MIIRSINRTLVRAWVFSIISSVAILRNIVKVNSCVNHSIRIGLAFAVLESELEIVFNRRMYSPLKSSRGQIAVFLVLLFQVLFVFFAMSMNMGLVVYDKINLQNSADLSVYYAAQKQAELLNQIAHINYQMRQAYKLLTFRIRVIGSVSIGVGPEAKLAPHPIRLGASIGQEGSSFFERLGSGRYVPGVCIGSSLWHEYKITEQDATVSLCQNLTSFSAVPQAGGSDPFGLTSGLNAFLDRVRGEIEEKCKVVGVLNWQLAASWYVAYIWEVMERKKLIDAIATNMSQPGSQMKDFTGGSVEAGARNTFTKNLTAPQRAAMGQFQLINSLSQDVPSSCSNKDFWLANIDIYPVVTYVSMIWSGLTCSTRVVPNRGNVPPSDYINMVGGRNNADLARTWSSGSPVSYGVEKNPWCMPYMGLKVQTQPRKIFSPFSTPPVLEAQAYAKPFGGRIGPWYSGRWNSGDATSSGLDRIDRLLPARSINGSRMSIDPADDLVNYSKYPGDRNGMNSPYALGAMNKHFTDMAGTPMAPSMRTTFALAHYNHVGDSASFDAEGDSLARANNLSGGPPAGMVRQMEEAAVAPDIFDVTYYSIEGQFSYNYNHPSDGKFRSAVTPKSIPDIGSSGLQPYSVVTQLGKVSAVYKVPPPFYAAAHPDSLLTGWTQNSATNYEFPTATFGKCDQRRDDEIVETPSPGGCPHGGRSGYSVKIVSQKYLRNVSAELGGPGNSGAILNPPPE